MLDQKGFDLWADGYDESVGVAEEEDSFPFAGYKQVLNHIYQNVMAKKHAKVLDIGFGTGTLTRKLYEQKCNIYGQDFSKRMLELAQDEMPDAHLYQGDFTQEIVEPIQKETFDFVIATYSLHHLTDEQKVDFLHIALDLLNPGGCIYVGDAAFQTREELEQCRKDNEEDWDDDEIYFVVDELKQSFPELKFEPFSYCAGVLTLRK